MGFRRRARRRGLIAGAAIGAAAAHHGGGDDAPPEQYEAAPAPPPAEAPASEMDQLQQLAELHASGALTDDEFAAAKAKILGG
jgi:Short C-terminal domain